MRSNGLTALYRKKAREVDQQNGGIPEGEVGKVERKVEDYGEDAVVFGAFWEASEGVHELIQIMAVSRLKCEGLKRGEYSENEVEVVEGQVRRLLSVMEVRSQAECCNNRMREVGRGNEAADRKRQVAAGC